MRFINESKRLDQFVDQVLRHEILKHAENFSIDLGPREPL
jgi:hypothetical protein